VELWQQGGIPNLSGPESTEVESEQEQHQNGAPWGSRVR